jgi:hypothetical protein
MDEDDFATICPMTGMYCQGDLAHLCDEYGCARKAGESPHSEFEQEL